MEEGHNRSGIPTATGVEAYEGGGSKRPPSSRSPDEGRHWTTNGEAIQTSGKDSDRFAITGRNKHAKNGGNMDMSSLPTTPPLTPPREQLQPLPPITSDPINGNPINGNRNNLSDSVHANFKTTKQLDAGASVPKDVLRKQLTGELERTNSPVRIPPSRMEATPPALVVISDNNEKRGGVREDQEVTEASPRKKVEEQDKPEFQDGREATPPRTHSPYANAEYSSHREKGRREFGSLQSMQVTSAGGSGHGREPSSSEEEEMEDVDLVLVEEEEEERGETPQQKDSMMGSKPAGSPVVGGVREGFVGVSQHRVLHQRQPPNAVVMNGSKEHTRNGHSTASDGQLGKIPSPEVENPSQGGDRFHRRNRGEGGVVRTVHMTNAKQAAKVKQFFTTIQQHGNKLGSEVAEQVQELIHAVMNETATVEEFHQEIQTITNYPLKDFIIPFLRDNVRYFRAELKESSQMLGDVLGSGEIPATSSEVTLTPQLVDDELPVVTNKHTTLRTISSLSSASKTTSSIRTSIPHSNSATNHVHGTSNNVQSHSHHASNHTQGHAHGTVTAGNSHSYSSSSVGVEEGVDPHRHHGNRQQVRTTTIGGMSTIGGVKRRRWSVEQGPSVVSVEKDKEIGQEKTMPKRMRTDGGDTIIITTPRPPPPPPAYHHPPPPVTHLVAVSGTTGENHIAYAPFQQDHSQRRHGRGVVLSEDWGHIDMMLTSVQGMLEKTRQSMAVLKERVTSTHIEMERREHERESIIQQRVNEAADKIQMQSSEERQRLLVDASKQMRDAVSAAKNELESKFQQAQSIAIQEALKENNIQSSSKEHCWNCGRRATETCSGCNKARYCGTFCQHKDWANHMHHCASGVPEESREPKRIIHAPLPAGEVARVSSNRGMPVVGAQQHHRTVAIPVNLISPQEVNLRLAPIPRPHQGHSDILVKTERT